MQQFTVKEYSEHYTRCALFQKKFREFDLRIGELLKKYSEPKENLLIIKFLLYQYINVVDKKIKESYEAENDLIFCRKCKVNPDIIYLSSCNHPICKKCFVESAEKNILDMKCNICQQMTIDLDKRNILGQSLMNKLEKSALGEVIENLIKCPNCGEQNEFEEGKIDYNVRDEKNQILSKQAAEDYAKYRCRCGFCKKDFCINQSCQAIPYHLGKTCKEYKDYIKSKKCRFCNQKIKEDNRGPDDDVIMSMNAEIDIKLLVKSNYLVAINVLALMEKQNAHLVLTKNVSNLMDNLDKIKIVIVLFVILKD
jgi:hypothetical protein